MASRQVIIGKQECDERDSREVEGKTELERYLVLRNKSETQVLEYFVYFIGIAAMVAMIAILFTYASGGFSPQVCVPANILGRLL